MSSRTIQRWSSVARQSDSVHSSPGPAQNWGIFLRSPPATDSLRSTSPHSVSAATTEHRTTFECDDRECGGDRPSQFYGSSKDLVRGLSGHQEQGNIQRPGESPCPPRLDRSVGFPNRGRQGPLSRVVALLTLLLQAFQQQHSADPPGRLGRGSDERPAITDLQHL